MVAVCSGATRPEIEAFFKGGGNSKALYTTDKLKSLVNASWQDNRFKTPQLIYLDRNETLASIQGAMGEYSDRLMEWNYESHKRASELVKDFPNTAQKHEQYLREYYKDESLFLKAIKAGADLASGYNYFVYIFRRSS